MLFVPEVVPNAKLTGHRFQSVSLLIGIESRLLREDRLAVHRNGSDDFLLVVIQRRQCPRLSQLDGHLEQLPVAGRDHGVGW